GAVAAAVLLGRLARSAPSTALLRTPVADLRGILEVRRVRLGVVVASGVAVLGHVALFMVAVRSAGADVSLTRMVPLALVVLLVAGLPINVAGWGPREGAAAWVFGATGLDAAQGVTAAVLYGVLVLVATLPGAVVLFVSRRRPGMRKDGNHG
ncbi:MAG: lysylphosphatidylglycerol synthase domain-containing protein, partial [Nocardioidaceae bacterium]